MVFPHLHICLHQISSVILLPTQSNRLLLQVCIIILAVQNKLLTSYSQQILLLTLLPCPVWQFEKHKCQQEFLAGLPLQSHFTMKNDHFLSPFGFFLLINYLFTHELSLLPHSSFASLKASGERPCWKPFGNYSRQHSQPFLIQLLLTFSKNGRSEKVIFICKSYNNYSQQKGLLLFQPRKFLWWNDNAGNLSLRKQMIFHMTYYPELISRASHPYQEVSKIPKKAWQPQLKFFCLFSTCIGRDWNSWMRH